MGFEQEEGRRNGSFSVAEAASEASVETDGFQNSEIPTPTAKKFIMNLHKKTTIWLKEFGALFHAAAMMTIHREPPEHYLGYTVAGKVPVILIPGVLGRWGYMKSLGDRISRLGHPVYIVPELGYNISSIPFSAKMLRSLIARITGKFGHILPRVSKGAEAIQKVIEEKNLKNVILVAHSKGGLIGKYLLTHYNADHKVLGMIAIAAPFSGSELAKLIPHDAFKELRTDSEIVRDLERHRNANKKIVSIFPEYDTHVWAERKSFLEGAENIEVSGLGGHNALLSDKKIQNGEGSLTSHSISMLCGEDLENAERATSL